MITATMKGRRLCLTVETDPEDGETFEPFYVYPLPARDGRELSTRYLFSIEGIDDGADIAADMIGAFGLENYERADTTLGRAEGELLVQAAYFWQMLGGMDAVRELLRPADDGSQGGEEAMGKAVAAFRHAAAPLLSQIRRRMESVLQTRTDATPATGSPDGGGSTETPPEPPPSVNPQQQEETAAAASSGSPETSG